MKISVVTAVLNRENTIGMAIDSIWSQTWPDIEHIIQDGGSTDSTIDIIQEKITNNTFLVSEPDSGLYDAINRGISRASGSIIGLLHSDDFFANKNILEKIASAFDDPSVDGVYGDLHYVAARDEGRIVRFWRSGVFKRSALRHGWMPPHPTLFLRREVFDRLGLYDTSYKISADYDAILRFLIGGNVKLAYIPEVFVKMRLGGASNGSLRDIIHKIVEDYHAIRTNAAGGLYTIACKNFRKFGQFFHPSWVDFCIRILMDFRTRPERSRKKLIDTE